MEIAGDVFEAIFGHVKTLREQWNHNNIHDALHQEGFSVEEAQQLGWFYKHRTTGRAIGITVGAVVAYTMHPWMIKLGSAFPVFRWSRILQWSVRLGVAFGTLQWFDYIFTGRRLGANQALANQVQWTNLKYAVTKDKFCQNFYVLNRPFTQEERKQFSLNQKQDQVPFQRRFTYNPYLHGDNEDVFKQDILTQYTKSVAPWERKDVQQQIAIQNQEKVQVGEVVRIKPYNILQHFDKSGIKHGLKLNPFINSWQIIG